MSLSLSLFLFETTPAFQEHIDGILDQHIGPGKSNATLHFHLLVYSQKCHPLVIPYKFPCGFWNHSFSTVKAICTAGTASVKLRLVGAAYCPLIPSQPPNRLALTPGCLDNLGRMSRPTEIGKKTHADRPIHLESSQTHPVAPKPIPWLPNPLSLFATI